MAAGVNRKISAASARAHTRRTKQSSSSLLSSGKMFEAKYHHMFWAPCAAHCMDLILEDIFNILVLKTTFKRAVTLCSYVYQRSGVVNLLREFSKKELFRPARTRFATAFITLGRIHDVQKELKQMFISQVWNASKWAKEPQGKKVVAIVLMVSFWQNVKYALNIFAPLVSVLKLVDNEKKPAMGYIYEAMERAKERIAKTFDHNEEKYQKVFEIIDRRWEVQLHRPLHAASHYLNPGIYYANTSRVENDEEVKSGLLRCIAKMNPNVEVQDKIIDELTKYKRASGLFGNDMAIRHREKKSPAEWWGIYGSSTPTLANFAIRVLSLTCSSSGCERNFSIFEHVVGIFKTLVVVSFTGFLAWAYQVSCPPAPKICGSPGGPPITAPRIKLRDGRNLAYEEYGVPKDTAKYKIIFVHCTDCCRHDALPTTVLEDLGVHMVTFDRPGYGESDPDPKRTVKSLALDIEELADQLGMGSKFYVIGFSMGGQVIWSCLKYIPHRLAGASLIAPAVNYWWSNLPANLTKEAFSHQLLQDQWAVRIAHYIPSLVYWWNTQKWFPSLSVFARSTAVLSPQDLEIMRNFSRRREYQAHIRQQGEYESIHRDILIGMGSWEFDPMDIKNPFPNNEGSVHLWQGDEDLPVPASLQRYVAQQLPWIQYHEISGAGHMFPFVAERADAILKALLIGESS